MNGTPLRHALVLLAENADQLIDEEARVRLTYNEHRHAGGVEQHTETYRLTGVSTEPLDAPGLTDMAVFTFERGGYDMDSYASILADLERPHPSPVVKLTTSRATERDGTARTADLVSVSVEGYTISRELTPTDS